jgi:hypothetical protein
MLKDPAFNAEYVYTGLISPTKQVTDAYWVPMNISVCFKVFISIRLNRIF